MLNTGLRIKENKEVYEGEVTELTPEETENQVCAIMMHSIHANIVSLQ